MRKRSIILIADFQKAFDSVDYNLLFRKLHNLNVSSKIINIFHSFYLQALACIKFLNIRTASTHVSRGVFEGESSSPSLFSFFLHDLEIHLKGEGCRGLSVNFTTEIVFLA